MKLFLFLFTLLSNFALFGQDSLLRSSLPCDTLHYLNVDSLKKEARGYMSYSKSGNVVCFGTTEGTMLAYRATGSNDTWITFALPFSDPLITILESNLDKKGRPEIIVKGELREYGSDGGQGFLKFLVFNVDHGAVQLMDITYSCFEEGFGRQGAKPFVQGVSRKVAVRDGIIIVSPLQRGRQLCALTKIPAGNYVLSGGLIRRRK
jgi:hypothetical protein